MKALAVTVTVAAALALGAPAVSAQTYERLPATGYYRVGPPGKCFRLPLASRWWIAKTTGYFRVTLKCRLVPPPADYWTSKLR